jgi:general stress protein 26
MRGLTADHVVAVAKATLDSADFSFLITQGAAGGASARPMRHVKPDADLTPWFGTSIASRKVREIRSTPRATVTCLDPQRRAYTALVGIVTIVVAGTDGVLGCLRQTVEEILKRPEHQ